MSTYVLIHGAEHGAWCWKKVVPLLQDAGHRVIALDLPGHGDDPAPLASQSISTYTQRVVEILDAQQEPVILVGHSMGGLTITQAAEERPEKIETLVYLAAFLLQNGQSPMDTRDDYPAVKVDSEQGLVAFDEAAAPTALYQDCSEEDIAFAMARLCPEPLATAAHVTSTTPERFGRVPRIYISTLHDLTLKPELQRRWYSASPCQEVFEMETGHSPFFSAPEQLVALLKTVAGQPVG